MNLLRYVPSSRPATPSSPDSCLFVLHTLCCTHRICLSSSSSSKSLRLRDVMIPTMLVFLDRLISELYKTNYSVYIKRRNIVIGNLLIENVERFRYLGVTVTNTNDIREEIKLRINMGNYCFYSLQKMLSSRLLSKKLKVNRLQKTIILPVVFYGCETWSLTLREEHRLKVFENKVLRKIFGTKMKLQENGGSYMMLINMHYILRLTLLGILNRDD